MKESVEVVKDWIKFEDKMPPINKTVEVKEEGVFSTRTIKSRLLRENGNFCFYLINDKDNFEKAKITHPMYWRYIIEKRPDFSKLKKGDLINIVWESAYELFEESGYFIKIDELDSCIILMTGPDGYGEKFHSDYIYNIKKITRINLKEKTFEEI